MKERKKEKDEQGPTLHGLCSHNQDNEQFLVHLVPFFLSLTMIIIFIASLMGTSKGIKKMGLT
jgi:hypothetical protein